MCKLCEESYARGRREMRAGVAEMGEALFRRRAAGSIIEPEQYFNGAVDVLREYRDSLVEQFRADGRPACPHEVNQA